MSAWTFPTLANYWREGKSKMAIREHFIIILYTHLEAKDDEKGERNDVNRSLYQFFESLAGAVPSSTRACDRKKRPLIGLPPLVRGRERERERERERGEEKIYWLHSTKVRIKKLLTPPLSSYFIIQNECAMLWCCVSLSLSLLCAYITRMNSVYDANGY